MANKLSNSKMAVSAFLFSPVAMSSGDPTHMWLAISGQIFLIGYVFMLDIFIAGEKRGGRVFYIFTFVVISWAAYMGVYLLLERLLGDRFIELVAPVLFYLILLGLPALVLCMSSKRSDKSD